MKTFKTYFCTDLTAYDYNDDNSIEGDFIYNKYQDKYFLSFQGLSKIINPVLCNDITKLFYSTINGEYIEPEIFCGSDYDEETDEYAEIYQYYIVSDCPTLDILEKSGELVYYLDFLDLYIWGVKTFGTPWCGVETRFELDANRIKSEN